MKLFVREPWSDEAVTVWEAADRRISSRLLYPEARAALAAAVRAGRLEPDRLGKARSELERLWAAIDCVELAPALARRAGDLAGRHGLRGYDAVHLASLEAVVAEDTVLVAADAPLLAAAESAGIDVVRLL